VQLHGDELPEQLAEFRQALGARRIIKTLQARELLADSSRLGDYLRAADSLDAILLDSGTKGNRGGTGVRFDWESAAPIAARIRERLPLIVAGGLRPENVCDAIRLLEPCGVDVVSGVERQTGKKDGAKVRQFIAAARPALLNPDTSL
jgi:phosphoribosylanthranilate isomerase